MPEFLSPVDIANRALQRVGAQFLDSTLGFQSNSKSAQQTSFCYGKLRRAELNSAYWRFSIREAPLRPIDTNTMQVLPALWLVNATYYVGSIVSDAAGTNWISTAPNNIGNQPNSLNINAGWVPYFGPLTAEPFDSSKSYFVGEIIYTFNGSGGYDAYLSLTDGNSVHPAVFNLWNIDTIYKTNDVVAVWPAWSSGTTYSQGQTVQYTDGNIYSSLTNSNLNNIPPSSGTNWALMPTLTLMSQLMPTSLFTNPPLLMATPIDEWQPKTTYSIGQFAMFFNNTYVSIANNNTNNYPNAAGSTFWAQCTGHTAYQSLIDLNQGNSPASSPAAWGTSTRNGNSQWIQIAGDTSGLGTGSITLQAFQVTYPIGCGPLSQSWTKNAYRLPSGFIRKAPQDPKAGQFSWLGAPGNLNQTDWQIEGDFLVTWESRAVIFRFVADVQDVTKFNDIFCEALSCRIALEICEPLTQSTAKLQFIAQEYKRFKGEAVTIDAIDAGPTQPPLDDLIACRV